MINNYKKVVFEKYATFSGRASRSEYWLFALANFLISLAIGLVLGLIAASADAPGIIALIYVYSLAVLIPSLAVAVRRLHDTNHSGWWFLICFVPFIGTIWLLVLMCTKSDPGANNYGELED